MLNGSKSSHAWRHPLTILKTKKYGQRTHIYRSPFPVKFLLSFAFFLFSKLFEKGKIVEKSNKYKRIVILANLTHSLMSPIIVPRQYFELYSISYEASSFYQGSMYLNNSLQFYAPFQLSGKQTGNIGGGFGTLGLRSSLTHKCYLYRITARCTEAIAGKLSHLGA